MVTSRTINIMFDIEKSDALVVVIALVDVMIADGTTVDGTTDDGINVDGALEGDTEYSQLHIV